MSRPKPERFNPARLNNSPRKNFDQVEARKAFDEVWQKLGDVKKYPENYSSSDIEALEEKLRGFSEKIDARVLQLPELVKFAQSILNGKVKVVRGFKGAYLGVYKPREKNIELRADLFKLVGDCERYEIALDAARDVLKEAGFAPDIVDSRRPDQIIPAIYENALIPEYTRAFRKKLNVEYGKAKRNGSPSAAIMVAAHEIMHAVDDLRSDGSRLGVGGGGVLGAIVGEIPRVLTSVGKIKGWGAVLSPEARKFISHCADVAAGPRPKNPRKLDQWKKYRRQFREQQLADFCKENRILTREVAIKELNDVIVWWQGLEPDSKINKYFEKPWERFAEAGAAFICNTQKFAEIAPNVYEAMLGNMRSRPAFWQNWQEFQRRLDNPNANVKETVKSVKQGLSEARVADLAQKKN